MTIDELIKLASNKISHLQQQKSYAEHIGDINFVEALENEIFDTEATLLALKSL
jgi:hypothetical protein